MSISNMNDIQEALEKDSRFYTTLQRGILSVDSDSWKTIPATDTEPTEVQVAKTNEGLFDVRPVNSGGELLSVPAEEVVPYIKTLTE
jgi:hypothetical protein